MSGSHTPGPWHVYRDEINDEDGLTVAHAVRFVPPYRAQSDANARLLAAAPDLLEALCLAHDYLAANGWEGDARMEPILAAIAKAEGRE